MALRPLLLAASALLAACRAAPSSPPAATASAPLCPTGGSWSVSLAQELLPEEWNTSLAALPDGRVAIVGSGGASIQADDAIWDPATGVFTRFARNEFWQDAAPTLLPLPDGRVLVFNDPGYAGTAFLSYEILDPTTRRWSRHDDTSSPGGMGFHLTTAHDGRLLLAYRGVDELAQLRVFDPATGTAGPNLLPARGFERRFPISASPDGVIFGGGGKPDEARLGHPFENLLPPKRGFPDKDLLLVDPSTLRVRVAAVDTSSTVPVPGLTAAEIFLFGAKGTPAPPLRHVDVRAGRTRDLPAPTGVELPANRGASKRLASGALLVVSGIDSHQPRWARCFDPATERWSVLPSPPHMPRGPSVALPDGRAVFLIAPDERSEQATGVMVFTP